MVHLTLLCLLKSVVVRFQLGSRRLRFFQLWPVVPRQGALQVMYMFFGFDAYSKCCCYSMLLWVYIHIHMYTSVFFEYAYWCILIDFDWRLHMRVCSLKYHQSKQKPPFFISNTSDLGRFPSCSDSSASVVVSGGFSIDLRCEWFQRRSETHDDGSHQRWGQGAWDELTIPMLMRFF